MNHGGYGSLSIAISRNHQIHVGAHRLMAHLRLGLDLLDSKQHACHHCDNPICFNPDHLFVGGAIDNVRDMIAKGRCRYLIGEMNVFRKLNDEKVKQIRTRRENGEVLASIAKDFGVDQTLIGRVVSRKVWSHVA